MKDSWRKIEYQEEIPGEGNGCRESVGGVLGMKSFS